MSASAEQKLAKNENQLTPNPLTPEQHRARAAELMQLTPDQRRALIAELKERIYKHPDGLTGYQRSLLKGEVQLLNTEEWREKLVGKKLADVTSDTVRLRTCS
jgi:hypothetical protein